MSLDTHLAFERHQPSADLRAFLDPLKPGSYFDCGEARLHGIDEALEAEAVRRGRPVGDDEFQLVATDGGLIFCRASITFAIAARWRDLVIARPEESEWEGKVLVPIGWPTHGELHFTVSRRLGSNVFRRWLQVQARTTRRSQVEQDVRFEQAQRGSDDSIDLRTTGDVEVDDGAVDHYELGAETDDGIPRPDDDTASVVSPGPHSGSATPTIRLDDSERDAIRYAAENYQADDGLGEDTQLENGLPPGPARPRWGRSLDADALQSWVDDRPDSDHVQQPAWPRRQPRQRLGVEPPAGRSEAPVRYDPGSRSDEPMVDEVEREQRRPLRHVVNDATATHFMEQTADGTSVFPGRGRYLDGLFNPLNEGGDDLDPIDDGEPMSRVPVPEIAGARLQRPELIDESPYDRPSVNVRSALLSGEREPDWVSILREHRVPLLAALSALALLLIVLIGFISGEDESVATVTTESTDTIGIPSRATGDSSDTVGVVPGTVTGVETGTQTTDPAAPSTALAAEEGESTLRVTSTSIQICHSNYGGCVPVAADVDCVGDGDGPAFQAEAVAVFGEDVYNLDTDGDRQACEPDQPLTSAVDGDG